MSLADFVPRVEDQSVMKSPVSSVPVLVIVIVLPSTSKIASLVAVIFCTSLLRGLGR